MTALELTATEDVIRSMSTNSNIIVSLKSKLVSSQNKPLNTAVFVAMQVQASTPRPFMSTVKGTNRELEHERNWKCPKDEEICYSAGEPTGVLLSLHSGSLRLHYNT